MSFDENTHCSASGSAYESRDRGSVPDSPFQNTLGGRRVPATNTNTIVTGMGSPPNSGVQTPAGIAGQVSSSSANASLGMSPIQLLPTQQQGSRPPEGTVHNNSITASYNGAVSSSSANNNYGYSGSNNAVAATTVTDSSSPTGASSPPMLGASNGNNQQFQGPRISTPSTRTRIRTIIGDMDNTPLGNTPGGGFDVLTPPEAIPLAPQQSSPTTTAGGPSYVMPPRSPQRSPRLQQAGLGQPAPVMMLPAVQGQNSAHGGINSVGNASASSVTNGYIPLMVSASTGNGVINPNFVQSGNLNSFTASNSSNATTAHIGNTTSTSGGTGNAINTNSATATTTTSSSQQSNTANRMFLTSQSLSLGNNQPLFSNGTSEGRGIGGSAGEAHHHLQEAQIRSPQLSGQASGFGPMPVGQPSPVVGFAAVVPQLSQASESLLDPNGLSINAPPATAVGQPNIILPTSGNHPDDMAHISHLSLHNSSLTGAPRSNGMQSAIVGVVGVSTPIGSTVNSNPTYQTTRTSLSNNNSAMVQPHHFSSFGHSISGNSSAMQGVNQSPQHNPATPTTNDRNQSPGAWSSSGHDLVVEHNRTPGGTPSPGAFHLPGDYLRSSSLQSLGLGRTGQTSNPDNSNSNSNSNPIATAPTVGNFHQGGTLHPQLPTMTLPVMTNHLHGAQQGINNQLDFGAATISQEPSGTSGLRSHNASGHGSSALTATSDHYPLPQVASAIGIGLTMASTIAPSGVPSFTALSAVADTPSASVSVAPPSFAGPVVSVAGTRVESTSSQGGQVLGAVNINAIHLQHSAMNAFPSSHQQPPQPMVTSTNGSSQLVSIGGSITSPVEASTHSSTQVINVPAPTYLQSPRTPRGSRAVSEIHMLMMTSINSNTHGPREGKTPDNQNLNLALARPIGTDESMLHLHPVASRLASESTSGPVAFAHTMEPGAAPAGSGSSLAALTTPAPTRQQRNSGAINQAHPSTPNQHLQAVAMATPPSIIEVSQRASIASNSNIALVSPVAIANSSSGNNYNSNNTHAYVGNQVSNTAAFTVPPSPNGPTRPLISPFNGSAHAHLQALANSSTESSHNGAPRVEVGKASSGNVTTSGNATTSVLSLMQTPMTMPSPPALTGEPQPDIHDSLLPELTSPSNPPPPMPMPMPTEQDFFDSISTAYAPTPSGPQRQSIQPAALTTFPATSISANPHRHSMQGASLGAASVQLTYLDESRLVAGGEVSHRGYGESERAPSQSAELFNVSRNQHTNAPMHTLGSPAPTRVAGQRPLNASISQGTEASISLQSQERFVNSAYHPLTGIDEAFTVSTLTRDQSALPRASVSVEDPANIQVIIGRWDDVLPQQESAAPLPQAATSTRMPSIGSNLQALTSIELTTTVGTSSGYTNNNNPSTSNTNVAAPSVMAGRSGVETNTTRQSVTDATTLLVGVRGSTSSGGTSEGTLGLRSQSSGNTSGGRLVSGGSLTEGANTSAQQLPPGLTSPFYSPGIGTGGGMGLATMIGRGSVVGPSNPQMASDTHSFAHNTPLAPSLAVVMGVPGAHAPHTFNSSVPHGHQMAASLFGNSLTSNNPAILSVMTLPPPSAPQLPASIVSVRRSSGSTVGSTPATATSGTQPPQSPQILAASSYVRSLGMHASSSSGAANTTTSGHSSHLLQQINDISILADSRTPTSGTTGHTASNQTHATTTTTTTTSTTTGTGSSAIPAGGILSPNINATVLSQHAHNIVNNSSVPSLLNHPHPTGNNNNNTDNFSHPPASVTNNSIIGPPTTIVHLSMPSMVSPRGLSSDSASITMSARGHTTVNVNYALASLTTPSSIAPGPHSNSTNGTVITASLPHQQLQPQASLLQQHYKSAYTPNLMTNTLNSNNSLLYAPIVPEDGTPLVGTSTIGPASATQVPIGLSHSVATASLGSPGGAGKMGQQMASSSSGTVSSPGGAQATTATPPTTDQLPLSPTAHPTLTHTSIVTPAPMASSPPVPSRHAPPPPLVGLLSVKPVQAESHSPRSPRNASNGSYSNLKDKDQPTTLLGTGVDAMGAKKISSSQLSVPPNPNARRRSSDSGINIRAGTTTHPLSPHHTPSGGPPGPVIPKSGSSTSLKNSKDNSKELEGKGLGGKSGSRSPSSGSLNASGNNNTSGKSLKEGGERAGSSGSLKQGASANATEPISSVLPADEETEELLNDQIPEGDEHLTEDLNRVAKKLQEIKDYVDDRGMSEVEGALFMLLGGMELQKLAIANSDIPNLFRLKSNSKGVVDKGLGSPKKGPLKSGPTTPQMGPSKPQSMSPLQSPASTTGSSSKQPFTNSSSTTPHGGVISARTNGTDDTHATNAVEAAEDDATILAACSNFYEANLTESTLDVVGRILLSMKMKAMSEVQRQQKMDGGGKRPSEQLVGVASQSDLGTIGAFIYSTSTAQSASTAASQGTGGRPSPAITPATVMLSGVGANSPSPASNSVGVSGASGMPGSMMNLPPIGPPSVPSFPQITGLISEQRNAEGNNVLNNAPQASIPLQSLAQATILSATHSAVSQVMGKEMAHYLLDLQIAESVLGETSYRRLTAQSFASTSGDASGARSLMTYPSGHSLRPMMTPRLLSNANTLATPMNPSQSPSFAGAINGAAAAAAAATANAAAVTPTLSMDRQSYGMAFDAFSATSQSRGAGGGGGGHNRYAEIGTNYQANRSQEPAVRAMAALDWITKMSERTITDDEQFHLLGALATCCYHMYSSTSAAGALAHALMVEEANRIQSECRAACEMVDTIRSSLREKDGGALGSPPKANLDAFGSRLQSPKAGHLSPTHSSASPRNATGATYDLLTPKDVLDFAAYKLGRVPAPAPVPPSAEFVGIGLGYTSGMPPPPAPDLPILTLIPDRGPTGDPERSVDTLDGHRPTIVHGPTLVGGVMHNTGEDYYTLFEGSQTRVAPSPGRAHPQVITTTIPALFDIHPGLGNEPQLNGTQGPVPNVTTPPAPSSINTPIGLAAPPHSLPVTPILATFPVGSVGAGVLSPHQVISDDMQELPRTLALASSDTTGGGGSAAAVGGNSTSASTTFPNAAFATHSVPSSHLHNGAVPSSAHRNSFLQNLACSESTFFNEESGGGGNTPMGKLHVPTLTVSAGSTLQLGNLRNQVGPAPGTTMMSPHKQAAVAAVQHHSPQSTELVASVIAPFTLSQLNYYYNYRTQILSKATEETGLLSFQMAPQAPSTDLERACANSFINVVRSSTVSNRSTGSIRKLRLTLNSLINAHRDLLRRMVELYTNFKNSTAGGVIAGVGATIGIMGEAAFPIMSLRALSNYSLSESRYGGYDDNVSILVSPYVAPDVSVGTSHITPHGPSHHISGGNGRTGSLHPTGEMFDNIITVDEAVDSVGSEEDEEAKKNGLGGRSGGASTSILNKDGKLGESGKAAAAAAAGVTFNKEGKEWPRHRSSRSPSRQYLTSPTSQNPYQGAAHALPPPVRQALKDFTAKFNELQERENVLLDKLDEAVAVLTTAPSSYFTRRRTGSLSGGLMGGFGPSSRPGANATSSPSPFAGYSTSEADNPTYAIHSGTCERLLPYVIRNVLACGSLESKLNAQKKAIKKALASAPKVSAKPPSPSMNPLSLPGNGQQLPAVDVHLRMTPPTNSEAPPAVVGTSPRNSPQNSPRTNTANVGLLSAGGLNQTRSSSNNMAGNLLSGSGTVGNTSSKQLATVVSIAPVKIGGTKLSSLKRLNEVADAVDRQAKTITASMTVSGDKGGWVSGADSLSLASPTFGNNSSSSFMARGSKATGSPTSGGVRTQAEVAAEEEELDDINNQLEAVEEVRSLWTEAAELLLLRSRDEFLSLNAMSIVNELLEPDSDEAAEACEAFMAQLNSSRGQQPAGTSTSTNTNNTKIHFNGGSPSINSMNCLPNPVPQRLSALDYIAHPAALLSFNEESLIETTQFGPLGSLVTTIQPMMPLQLGGAAVLPDAVRMAGGKLSPNGASSPVPDPSTARVFNTGTTPNVAKLFETQAADKQHLSLLQSIEAVLFKLRDQLEEGEDEPVTSPTSPGPRGPVPFSPLDAMPPTPKPSLQHLIPATIVDAYGEILSVVPARSGEGGEGPGGSIGGGRSIREAELSTTTRKIGFAGSMNASGAVFGQSEPTRLVGMPAEQFFRLRSKRRDYNRIDGPNSPVVSRGGRRAKGGGKSAPSNAALTSLGGNVNASGFLGTNLKHKRHRFSIMNHTARRGVDGNVTKNGVAFPRFATKSLRVVSSQNVVPSSEDHDGAGHMNDNLEVSLVPDLMRNRTTKNTGGGGYTAANANYFFNNGGNNNSTSATGGLGRNPFISIAAGLLGAESTGSPIGKVLALKLLGALFRRGSMYCDLHGTAYIDAWSFEDKEVRMVASSPPVLGAFLKNGGPVFATLLAPQLLLAASADTSAEVLINFASTCLSHEPSKVFKTDFVSTVLAPYFSSLISGTINYDLPSQVGARSMTTDEFMQTIGSSKVAAPLSLHKSMSRHIGSLMTHYHDRGHFAKLVKVFEFYVSNEDEDIRVNAAFNLPAVALTVAYAQTQMLVLYLLSIVVGAGNGATIDNKRVESASVQRPLLHQLLQSIVYCQAWSWDRKILVTEASNILDMCVMDDNTDDFNMPSPLVTGSFPKMHKKQGVAAWSRFVGRLSGHSPIATQVPTPMLAVAQLLADNPANIVPPPNAISSSNFNTIFNFPFYSSTPQGTGVTPPTTPLPYSVSLVTTPTSQSLQPPSGNQINTSMSESTKDREDSTVNVPYDWALSIIDGLTADSSLDVRQTVASSLHEVTGIAARQHLLTCTLCMGSPQQNPSDNGRVGPSNNNDSPGPKGSSHISIATALMGVAGSSNQLHRGAGGQQQQVPEICGVFGSNTAATLASHSPAQNTLNILLRLLDDSDFVIANSAMKRIGEICSDIAIVGSGSGVAVSLLDGQPVLGSMRERRQFLQPVLARLQKQEKQTYGASWRKLEEVHKKLASLWLPSGFSSAFSSANCAASGHAALVNPEIAAGSFTLQRGVSLYSLASPQSDPSRHHSYEMLHDPTAINNTTFGNDGTTKGGQPPSQSRDSLCSRLYLSQLNRVVVSNCLPETRRNQEANLPRTSFSNFSVMTGASAAQAPTLAGASMNNVNAPISNKMPSMAAMTNTSRPVFARDKDKDKDPDAVKGTRERTVNIIGGNLPEKNAADREPGSPGLRREHSFGQSTMSTFQLSLPPGTFIKVERRQGAVANSLANTRLSLSVGSMGPPSTSTFGARVSSTYHYPGGSTPSSSGGLNQNSPLQGNTLEYTLNSCLNLAMALQSLTPFAFLEYLYDSSRMSITRLRPHRDTERLQQFSQSSGLTSLVPSITAGGFAVSLAEHVLHHAPLIPAVLPIKQNIFSLPMLSAMEAFDSLSIGSFLHQTLNGAAQGKAFWASLFVAVLRRASVEGGSIAMIISEAQNANFSGFSSQQSPLAMLLNRRDVSGTAANAMSSSVNGPLSKSINKSVGPKSRRSQVGGDPSSEHYHTRDTAPSQVAVLASNGINHMSENINVFIVTYLLNEWLSMAPFDSGLNPQAPKYRGPSIIQGAGAIASSNSITGISGTVTNATAGRHKITAGSMISTPSSANNTAKRRVAFVFIAAEISKLDPKGFAACCGAKFLSMNFNQDTSIAVRRTLVASIEAFHATDLAIPLLTSFLEDPDPRLQLEAKGKLSFYIDVGELIATNPNDNDNKTINDGASEMFVGGAGLDLDGGFPAHETPIIIVPGAESSAAAGNSPMRSAADSSTVGNPIGMTLAQVDATLTNSNNNLLSANRTSGKNPSSPTSKTDATDDSFYRHALLKSCGSGRMIGLGAAKRSFRSKEQLAAESKAENKSQGNLGGSSFYDNVNSVVLGGSSNLLSVGGITSGSLAGGVKSNHTNPFLAPSATSGEGSNVPNKAALGKAGFLDGSLNSAHEEGPPTASAVSSHKNATNAQSGAKRQSNVSLIGAPTVLPTDKLPLTTTANNTSSSNENSKSGKDAVVKVGEDGHRAGAAKPTIAAHQQLAQNSNNNSNSNPNDFFDSMPAVVDITRGPVSLPIGSSIMSVIDNAFLENPTDTAVAFGGFGSILSSQLQRLFLRNAN